MGTNEIKKLIKKCIFKIIKLSVKNVLCWV